MRIALIDSWLQGVAEGSGTAAGIGGLRGALLAQGHAVDRLAPPSDWPANLTARRIWFNLQLPKLLRQPRYDLIVGHDLDGFRWAGLPRTVPYLVSVKGVIAEEALHERGAIRRLLWGLSRLERLNVRRADGILTTSEYCAAAIGRHYGVERDRIRIVPEGIDLARWDRIAATTPHQTDGATILCVARQYPRKHVQDLIRALPLVRSVVPNVRAVIVGDGPEHAALRELTAQLGLADAVALRGALPDDDAVARLYRQADVFCLPSVQEGFGIVFLEAMASGLPIVATSAAAIPEVVPQDQAGLLVPPGDFVALARALTALLTDPARRRVLGGSGARHVRQYDWNAVARRFLAQVEPFVRAAG